MKHLSLAVALALTGLAIAIILSHAACSAKAAQVIILHPSAVRAPAPAGFFDGNR